MQILYITCHLSKILSEPGSAGFKTSYKDINQKKGQHFKELGPLVLHYSACSGCDLYIRTFRDMSPRNILHREADMLRPVSRRVSATQMMTFWYFLAMTKHNLSIFVNKDCQSKSFFLGAGQANSLLFLDSCWCFFMGFKAPTSTLLLLVPSAESFRAVRNLYQQQGQDVGQKN